MSSFSMSASRAKARRRRPPHPAWLLTVLAVSLYTVSCMLKWPQAATGDPGATVSVLSSLLAVGANNAQLRSPYAFRPVNRPLLIVAFAALLASMAM